MTLKYMLSVLFKACARGWVGFVIFRKAKRGKLNIASKGSMCFISKLYFRIKIWPLKVFLLLRGKLSRNDT